MKPGGVVSLKRINFVTFFGRNRLLLFLFFTFITGFFVSNMFFGGSKVADFSDFIFANYISDRKGAAFLKILFSVFFKYFTVCLALFIAGTSPTGVVLSPIICCTLGLYFGILTSYTYSAFSFKGIAFNAVILIPSALIFTISILFAAKEAFKFSGVLLRLTLPKSRPMNLSGEFKVYCGKFLLYLIFSLLAAVVDAVVSGSFIKYFNFV